MNIRAKISKILTPKDITRTFIFVLISIFMFYLFNPIFLIYTIVLTIFWIMFLINYKIQSNSKMFLNLFIFSIINLLILGFMKYLVHGTLHKNLFNIFVLLSYLFLLLIILTKTIKALNKINDLPVYSKILFNSRKYDLERILKYIQEVNIIGVNGIWGSGKSFLIEHMKNKLMDLDKYIFIQIDLLSCNLDELQIILFNEMELAFYEHRILPKYSYKLKRLLHENTIYQSLLRTLVQEQSSYSETLSGFIEETKKLGKIIVIVYEDIDRISNIDTIKKIFSISEKMASNNIKIIYQYDEDNLEKLDLNRQYLEKYIPFVVNLTPIKFIEIIQYVLNEQNIDNDILESEDFTYLILPVHLNHEIENTLGINYSTEIRMDNASIRKTENFIKELVIIFNEKKQFRSKNNKKTVINFVFIKHFFTELYNQFALGEGLLDTIKFNYKESQYTILELIAIAKSLENKNDNINLNFDDFKSIFEIPENVSKLLLMNLFEYNFREIIDGSPEDIINKESNEIKDRIIFNLLCNGKSEYTNYEIAANKLIEDVLSKPIEEQDSAYTKFGAKMYNGDHVKRDNETIFFMGVPQFISLSQALRVKNVDESIWKKFIVFYLYYTKKNSIDLELIQILSYLDLNSKELYLFVLKKFNKLDIVGNMNKEKDYRKFLKYYLRQISRLGYANTTELHILDVHEEIELESKDIEDATHFIKYDIKKVEKVVKIQSIQEDLSLILEFIDKNIEISKSKSNLSSDWSKINMGFSSSRTNQKEFDRLHALTKSMRDEELMKELETSYKNGHIRAYEIKELLQNKNL